MPSKRYSAPAQTFHWLSVLFVGIAWALGLVGDELPKGAVRATGLSVHIFAGQLVVALLVLRIVWRFVDPPPPPEPSPKGPRAVFIAKFVQFALYLLLLAVPVLGVATRFAGGDPLPLFGLAEIASPWAKDKAFEDQAKEIHELLAHSLIVLAMVHAGAAWLHHSVFGDRTLKRMLPKWMAE